MVMHPKEIRIAARPTPFLHRMELYERERCSAGRYSICVNDVHDTVATSPAIYGVVLHWHNEVTSTHK